MFVATSQCPEVVAVENAQDVHKVAAPGGGERDHGALVGVTCQGAYMREPDIWVSVCRTTGKWQPPVPQCVGEEPMMLIKSVSWYRYDCD
jgi:hypothetical protein